MKTLLKAYIWTMYILSLPVFLIYSLVLLAHFVYEDVKETGKADVFGTLKVYIEGCVIGHKINMARIDDLYPENEVEEEGV